MTINPEALIDLWNIENVPACPAGMELARQFLIVCGMGVDRLGVEEPGDRVTEIEAAYKALADHGADCPDCNEE
jgi:hypothetical protein